MSVKEEYDNPDTDYINTEGYILEGEDFPAEFKWCGMDTVNLVRGYFQDIFSTCVYLKFFV